MKISQILKNYFCADVRGRASLSSVRAQCRILQGTDSGFSATVYGSTIYSVVILIEDAELNTSCTCPYFIDRGTGCSAPGRLARIELEMFVYPAIAASAMRRYNIVQ